MKNKQITKPVPTRWLRRETLLAFAHHLDTKFWLRHALFLLAAVLAILFIGYHFGTQDQTIHIPFLKIKSDPTLYPGDPFFEMRHQHYSYFWRLFIPAYRLGYLEEAMLAAHVLTTYLAFCGLWTLSKTLFDDALTATLSVLLLIPPHLSFGGFQLFEFSLLNRTFVFPFMLWAIILFLRRRYVWAFVLLGAMYNLHVISVNFVLGMLLFSCLAEWRKVDWLQVVVGMGGFVVAALPVLLWKMSGSGIDLSLRPEWLDILARGIIANVFYPFATLPITLLTLSGVGGLGLFFVSYRSLSPRPEQRTVLCFVLSVLFVLGVHVASILWFPVTLLIQFQILRIGFWGVLFGYLYFANYLARTYHAQHYPPFEWNLLVLTTAFAPLAFIPALLWALWQWRAARVAVRRVVAVLALGALLGGCGVIVARENLWQPGLHLYGPRNAWMDVQLWAKHNTPQDTLFITPPHLWGLYESEWRVFSERSTVSTLSELLEAAFVPEYIDYWRPRFEALAPGALAQLEGDFFADVQRVAAAYYGLSDAALLAAAAEYSAAYIVVEKPHTRAWPIVYENAEYVVYMAMPTW